MTTFYADFVNGSDSNNGLGPDASHATNKPWKTLTKALGAAGIGNGDTVYLSPAGYFRETVSVAMTSATSETFVVGDPTNTRGFKTSGGVLVSPGPIVLTPFTTNDKTTPSTNTTLVILVKNRLTFQNIMVVGANNVISALNLQGSANVKFTDCSFSSYGMRVRTVNIRTDDGTGTTPAAIWSSGANHTFERCRFLGIGGNSSTEGTVYVDLGGSPATDYNSVIAFRNCSVIGGASFGIFVGAGAADTGLGGGVSVKGCFIHGTRGVGTATTGISTTYPVNVTSSFIVGGTAGLSAGSAGTLTEDYNLIYSNSPRTNVTAGTHSQANTYAPMFHFGQELNFSQNLRPFGEPMDGSPLLGFGDDGTLPATDIMGRTRPSGGQNTKAVGAYERGNSGKRETSVTHTGTNALRLDGPGCHDFDVPVDAAAVTFSMYLRFDSTYAGTLPQIRILANPAIGLSEQTATCTAAANAWQKNSLSLTPTAKGIATIRVISNDTNGAGKAYADTFEVA